MQEVIHGRLCVKLGNRYFAVQKDLDRAARIATLTAPRAMAWDRIARMPKTAKVILNAR